MQGAWLEDVIIVNDNNADVPRAGDVTVYRNEGELTHHLEYWYVNEPHLALTGIGDRAVLGLCEKLVIVERREPYADGRRLLIQWLTAKAKYVLQLRRERAKRRKIKLGKMEAQGLLPDTVEGLIAYVGFDK